MTWWQVLLVAAAASLATAALIFVGALWVWTDGFRRTGLG